MLPDLQVKAEDRILLLAIPDPAVVFHLAHQVTQGLVVCLGPDEEVREARRLARDLDNIMFIPGGPDDIPWQDGFFSLVIDVAGLCADGPTPEVARVLAVSGRISRLP